MLCMPIVSDVRRDNARLLAKACGGLASFAKRIGRSDPYVSQLIGVNPQRGIGHQMARHIEMCFDKSPGWLDAPHDDVEPLTDTAVAWARFYQSLSAEDRERLVGLAKITFGHAVPDDVVEQRMPITKRIDTPND